MTAVKSMTATLYVFFGSAAAARFLRQTLFVVDADVGERDNAGEQDALRRITDAGVGAHPGETRAPEELNQGVLSARRVVLLARVLELELVVADRGDVAADCVLCLDVAMPS